MKLAFARRPLFLWLVAVPNFVSLAYFGFIASPVYTSRTSLIVLNPTPGASSLSSLLSGGSGDGSSQGAYLLKEFIGSWDEVSALDRRLHLARHYAEGDIVSRYGGLLGGFARDDVALWRYVRKRIIVKVDLKSGIAAIEARGYRPDFAQALAQALLADSSAHLNRMNARQERDLIGHAEQRKAHLEQVVREDEAALATERRRTNAYDPKDQYLSNLSLVNDLKARNAEYRSQFDAIVRATPNSPEAKNIATAMAALDDKIAEAQAHSRELSRASARWDTLVAKRDTDVKLLQQASGAAQDAQQRAAQNQYYLNIISAPSAPKTPERPHRLYWICGILLGTLLLWGLLR